jgi:hypothetical protein
MPDRYFEEGEGPTVYFAITTGEICCGQLLEEDDTSFLVRLLVNGQGQPVREIVFELVTKWQVSPP